MDATTDGPSRSPAEDSGRDPPLTAPGEPAAAQEQRRNSGGRRPDGTFSAGNRWRWRQGQSANAGGRRPGMSYAKRSRELDAKKASAFKWSREEAKVLGLDPRKTTIGELVVHAAKYHAIRGKVGYFVEDLDRTEGKVPDVVKGEIEGEIDVVHHIAERLMTDPAANKAARDLERRLGLSEN